MWTPWGKSDRVQEYPNGIKFASTPSHGGFWVPAKLLGKIPKAHQEYAKQWSGLAQWYEEDCAWACVALAFPEIFSLAEVTMANEIVKEYVDP